MSRSYKKPFGPFASGAEPRKGKQKTSRDIRRKVNVLLSTQGDEFDFYHIQDKVRGKHGSKDRDWGWDYFGDGYVNHGHFYGDGKMCRK